MAGIPPIAPYPMPTQGELPQNTADWTVDPGRAVLLMHDMQRFFLRSFPVDDAPGDELVHNAALLRGRCAALGIPVAYTAQPGGMTPEQRGLQKDFWGPGMRTDPADREVVPELAPAAADWLLTKWRYSAFFKTDLLQRMRSQRRDQLVICGVYAHIGVLMTAVDAFTHDIQPFLAADAVADFSESYHRLALEYAAGRCARVTTTKSLLSELGGGGPG
ncbi:isochorismatase family protein [Streptomyces tendae]|uniref:isochorismatase family protein n=1 Tax=Streptomyces tendae TaxID=1932 RepID=UPI0037B5799A